MGVTNVATGRYGCCTNATKSGMFSRIPALLRAAKDPVGTTASSQGHHVICDPVRTDNENVLESVQPNVLLIGLIFGCAVQV
jgi:hypothetical protein